MNPPLSARRLAALLLAFGAARCANLPPKTPAGAPPPPAPSPSPVFTRATPGRPSARAPIPVPPDAAPSGTLLRIGWKSDLSEFVFGPPGQRWVVVSQGQAELLRGTLRVKPEPAGFQVQAGAFSQEEPARDRAGKLAADFQTSGSVAFSADRGVYRVLLGNFSDRAAAEALAEKLRGAGEEALVAEGGGPLAGPRAMGLTGEDGEARRLLSPVDLYPSDGEARILLDGKPYRGSLRVLVNPRGTLNVVNRVDLEEYLYGVVPSEMGPRRYDEIEALKAQAVAARTYALAHRGQFGAEDYDLCATAKCQVYSGLSVEDPLSNAAVDATRGLVIAHEGKLADALFTSTCGGRTEDVANVFGEPSMPYLVSVQCGELDTITLLGRVVDRRASANARSGLEWRGYVVAAHAVRKKGARAAALATAQKWAGVGQTAAPAATLSPAAVYPSLVAAFDLAPARALHLLPQQERYFAEAPAASGRLSGAAREAYDFLLRFRVGAGEALPPPDRNVTEEEYAGLLFSAALRLTGVTEAAGRFVRREGSNLWVKTPEGRQGLPVDPDLPLARRVGDHFFPVASLTLRPGDRLRWWKRGGQSLALWVELDAAGPSFERESAWTEWVRRASGRELARRMAARVAGTEVLEIAVTRRSSSGRVIGARVTTDTAQIALARFDVRQALELPELAFTVTKARGPQGEIEFVFLGRGWGHGVGLCQNGAYGMAIAGAAYDAILRHYYTGIQIVSAGTVTAATPSAR